MAKAASVYHAALARWSILVGSSSIVVLPFSSLSADADQEYFADSITEDLIIDLPKISELLLFVNA